MHLFITGGTGFFGKALLRFWKNNPYLIDKYNQITILSRNPDEFKNRYYDLLYDSKIIVHKGDILHPSTLPSNCNITHVIHAATDSTIGPQLPPLDRYNQIVIGTQNVLDFAVKNKAKRILLTSSGGAYGKQPEEMAKIPETYCGMPDPLDPNEVYSVAKRCAEHLCALYQHKYGLDTVITRCFAFVGRDLPMDVHFAIGNFMWDALNKSEIIIAGDGMPIRSYMDQRDLASWLMTILENGKAGQSYNVGSDQEIYIKDLALLVRDLIAPQKQVRIMDKSALMKYRNRYVPSIEKARTELGLSLSYTLAESIQEVISHFNNNEN